MDSSFGYSLEMRKQVVTLAVQGVSISEVARRTGIARRTIQRWMTSDWWAELEKSINLAEEGDGLLASGWRDRGSVKRRKPSTPIPGSVYFIEDSASGHIKIGYSTNIAGRLKELQGASAARLKLLCSIPGTRETERFFHRTFSSSRIRGEWFAVTPEMTALIATLSAGNACDRDCDILPEPLNHKRLDMPPASSVRDISA